MEDRVSMLLGEQVLSEPGGLGSPPEKIYRLKEDQAFSLSLELGRRENRGFRFSTIEDKVSMLLAEQVLSEPGV
jgi:hypothetical protein